MNDVLNTYSHYIPGALAELNDVVTVTKAAP